MSAASCHEAVKDLMGLLNDMRQEKSVSNDVAVITSAELVNARIQTEIVLNLERLVSIGDRFAVAVEALKDEEPEEPVVAEPSRYIEAEPIFRCAGAPASDYFSLDTDNNSDTTNVVLRVTLHGKTGTVILEGDEVSRLRQALQDIEAKRP